MRRRRPIRGLRIQRARERAEDAPYRARVEAAKRRGEYHGDVFIKRDGEEKFRRLGFLCAPLELSFQKLGAAATAAADSIGGLARFFEAGKVEGSAEIVVSEGDDEICPKRDDRTHCVHWWDGDEPCCSCGAGGSATEEYRRRVLGDFPADLDTIEDSNQGPKS